MNQKFYLIFISCHLGCEDCGFLLSLCSLTPAISKENKSRCQQDHPTNNRAQDDAGLPASKTNEVNLQVGLTDSLSD